MNYYANFPVKVAKQKIEYPNGDFSISIPIHWEWQVEDYGNENILLGIDVGSNLDKDGFIDIISIQKIKSFGLKKDLKSEFEYCLNLFETNFTNVTIIESGLTDILTEKAYVLHTKSDTNTYGETETINLILESETKGVFYYLVAAASQTDDLKKNMAVLVQCLKTFKSCNSE